MAAAERRSARPKHGAAFLEVGSSIVAAEKPSGYFRAAFLLALLELRPDFAGEPHLPFDLLTRDILTQFMRAHADLLWLHAGVVEDQGGAVIIVGPATPRANMILVPG